MNHNIFLRAIAISLVSNNGKFSYSQTGEMYSKVSSYQVKMWLDKHWDEQKELEKHIIKLNIDRSKGWLMIDGTVIEKPFSKTNECVYWQYSSKNASSSKLLNWLNNNNLTFYSQLASNRSFNGQ